MTDRQKRIIGEFNDLPDVTAQHEVLDAIYFAMYRKSYLQVIGNRVVRERDARIRELEDGAEQLRLDLLAVREELREAEDRIREVRVNPCTLWRLLPQDEREAFKAEMIDAVFYRNLKAEAAELRRQLKSERAALSEALALVSAMRIAAGTQETGPSRKPSIINRIFKNK